MSRPGRGRPRSGVGPSCAAHAPRSAPHWRPAPRRRAASRAPTAGRRRPRRAPRRAALGRSPVDVPPGRRPARPTSPGRVAVSSWAYPVSCSAAYPSRWRTRPPGAARDRTVCSDRGLTPSAAADAAWSSRTRATSVDVRASARRTGDIGTKSIGPRIFPNRRSTVSVHRSGYRRSLLPHKDAPMTSSRVRRVASVVAAATLAVTGARITSGTPPGAIRRRRPSTSSCCRSTTSTATSSPRRARGRPTSTTLVTR